MLKIFLLFITLLTGIHNSTTVNIEEVELSLKKVLLFIENNFNSFGFDGIFGVNLAYTQLVKSLNYPLSSICVRNLLYLINKCQNILNKANTILPNGPPYMIIFRNKLLNSKKWIKTLPSNFITGEIHNVGIYDDWTVSKILNNKKAEYKGVKSDYCINEILNTYSNKICIESNFCRDMMLNTSRIDTGYLLTHRLLYIQIKMLTECQLSGNEINFKKLSNLFCNAIYKEAKTNEHLQYPYHDIFLEQVVLCGSMGYSEFLNEKWLYEILKWQNPHGCYQSVKTNIIKRTSIPVGFNCTDHTTGLGAAALALNLRYLLFKNNFN